MKVQHWKPSEMKNIIFEIYVDNVWCYEKKKTLENRYTPATSSSHIIIQQHAGLVDPRMTTPIWHPLISSLCYLMT